MPTLTRHAAWLLLVLLCGCQQQPIQGSYRCPHDVQFHFNRQSQTVELTHAGKAYQGFMDERRLLTWPRRASCLALPDSFVISRKNPNQLMLYGGLASTGQTCLAVAILPGTS